MKNGTTPISVFMKRKISPLDCIRYQLLGFTRILVFSIKSKI